MGARHITVGSASGPKTYLVRGDWSEEQLKSLYESFKAKYHSDMPFERWLVERGKVYVRTKDSATDRRARLHRALDVVMDRAMPKTGDAYGEPVGRKQQANVAYFVHGIHGMKTPTLAGNYHTKPEAIRAAQQAANEEGETITISTPKGPWVTVQPRVAKAADAYGADTEETRTYEVKAPREVLDRFEAFLSHVEYCGGVGHSTIVGMPIDGDGPEYFNVIKPTKLPEIEHELSDKEQRVEVPRHER